MVPNWRAVLNRPLSTPPIDPLTLRIPGKSTNDHLAKERTSKFKTSNVPASMPNRLNDKDSRD